MVPADGACTLVRAERVAAGTFFGRQILLCVGFLLRWRRLSDALAACAHAQELSDGLRLQESVTTDHLPLLDIVIQRDVV